MENAWKSVIEADLASTEYKPKVPVPEGDYNAFVSSVEAKIFKTGAKGLALTFVVEDGPQKDKEVRDNIIVILKTGAANFQGSAIVKKLMMAAGLTKDEILNFRFPEFGTKGFGDFSKILGKPLAISTKLETQDGGQYHGRVSAKVKSFKARE